MHITPILVITHRGGGELKPHYPYKRGYKMKNIQLSKHIETLESLTPVHKIIDLGTEFVRLLFNPETSELCQICEFISKDCVGSSQIDVALSKILPDHMHEKSDELFYVIQGRLLFTDGSILNAGESRLIKKGSTHGGHLDKSSKAIIIIRPPEEKLK